MNPDNLSNRALDAIEAGNYALAEKLCRRLLRNYPTLFDGHDRLGLLRSAQGRFAHAAEHFSIVLSMMKKDPFGVDHETIKEFTRLRDEALARVKD
jgi:tetratricopeptide (TPR) repeat protein